MSILTHRGFTYDVDTNKSTALLIEANTNDSKIEIPPVVKGYCVTGIGSTVFKDNRHIKTALLPDTLTLISTGAFLNSSIKNFKIYSSGKSSPYKEEALVIKASAFRDCSDLNYVEIKKPIILSQSSIFENCCKLEYFPSEFIQDRIPRYAFRNCHHLHSFTVKKPIAIERLAFMDAKIDVFYDFGYIHSFDIDFLEAVKNAQIHCYDISTLAELVYDGYNIVLMR